MCHDFFNNASFYHFLFQIDQDIASDVQKRPCQYCGGFLGRKVYLGVVVILLTALNHGLTQQRRQQLFDQLDINPQTFYRWLRWWRDTFPASRCWQSARGRFIPPVDSVQLPGALLGRFTGHDLKQRLCQLLQLLLALTTSSCCHFLRGVIDPQKM